MARVTVGTTFCESIELVDSKMNEAARPLFLGLATLVCFFFAITSTHADTIYVSNFGNGTIEKLDSSGHGTLFASGLNDPFGLALDGSGNLYVANYNSDNILKFDAGGHGSVFASSGLNWPLALAVDRSGNLYVGNPGNNTIEKFDSSGHGTFFASFGSISLYGLAFDSSGNLYAANNDNGTIEKFDSNGTDLGVFASGLSGPTFIAIQIPEPATWSLLALGALTLLGGCRLHRR